MAWEATIDADIFKQPYFLIGSLIMDIQDQTTTYL